MFAKKKAARKQTLKKNHKLGSRTKYFNNNIETSISGSPKATFVGYKPKVNSVRFVDQYDHINTTENTNDANRLVNSHKEQIKKQDDKEYLFDDTIEKTISEEEL